MEWTARPQRLGLPACDVPFLVPAVTQPPPLAESVAAWVEQQVAERRSWLADAGECRLREVKEPVVVRRVRGFVTVSFWAPEPMEARFSSTVVKTFAFRTGTPFSRIVADAKRDLLVERLRPRYRIAMADSPDCVGLRDQYVPNLDDFAVTERGFSFSGWTSLPMSAMFCYPENEPIFTVEELELFLEPEALAAWRDE